MWPCGNQVLVWPTDWWSKCWLIQVNHFPCLPSSPPSHELWHARLVRYQRSEQNCLNTRIWFNFYFVDQLKREFCGIMFHDPACQRSQMFGKSFTPKTLSVGHWIILSVSGFPFRSLFLLRFPRLLDPPGAGVGGENRWSGSRVRLVSRVSHTAGWHPLHISWVAPGWADIAPICISIQTGLYYSPIYRFCITDHHSASRLLSETFQSTTINVWKLFLTLGDPNICS